MGYSIRPLATLATQATQFFTQAVPGAIVRLWPNTFRVLGKVLALLDFEHEMRRQWLFKQQFASTADPVWLARHGFELGLTPDPGSPSTGTITVAAPAGTVVPADVQWSRDDGATYATLVPTTSPGPTVDLVVQADQVGTAFDMEAGDTLALVVSAGVPQVLADTATVGLDGLTGGVDPEGTETFRARVLYRKRNPPQGGSEADYIEWVGESLASAKAVFVDSFANDERSVWVCFTVSDRNDVTWEGYFLPDAGALDDTPLESFVPHTYGIPSDQQVATVQSYISDPVRRPVTARVFATAPTPIPVPIQLQNFAPDTPDTRGAVLAEIVALQVDEMRPAKPNEPFTLYVEQIEAAINRATGVKTFTLVSPAGDITFTAGSEMPALQPPTYA